MLHCFSMTAANKPPLSSVKIENILDEINETDCTEYLDIMIDQNLKWQEHTFLFF